MKSVTLNAHRGFSLVELLVVVTILAIISTVAYTSFSGSTDKAKNSKRLEHMNTAETAISMFRQEKQYLPLPNAKSNTNLWGYTGSTVALMTNTGTFTLSPDKNNILDVTSGSGGGVVYLSGASTSTGQIGAKGTLEQSLFGKQYISQDITDPSGDTKVGDTKTLKDFGIGRYVYAVYAKPTGATWNADTKSATAFNIAITVLDDQKGYVTKIGGDFDDKYGSCNGTCPVSLIGPGGTTTNLIDGDSGTKIPYIIKY